MVRIRGVYDMHVHSYPDIVPRRCDDVELAQAAAAAGMGGLMIKSHHGSTVERAILVQRVVPSIRIFGGITLGPAVGGFNPAAVELALRQGAKEVWMPTLSAANHLALRGSAEPGLSVWDEERRPVEGLLEILDLIALHDVILGTGHLSLEEITFLVPAALDRGIRKIFITHPELDITRMPIAMQRELALPGVHFERCLICTTRFGGGYPFAEIVGNIRAIGVDSTVLATDFGQAANPHPVEAMADYLDRLAAAGFTESELERMAVVNQRIAMGLA